MASSGLLLRRWSAAQIFRSRAVAADSSYSSCLGNSFGELSAANRTITTTSSGVSSPESLPAPWLMMRPCSLTGESIWRFYCCAKNNIYSFLPDGYNRSSDPEIGCGLGVHVELVGSSQGWLATYDGEKRDLFLSDPIATRHTKLPPPPPPLPPIETMEQVHSVVLDEREGKAFMISGPGRSMAFCSPGRTREWTLFGGGEYESVVYSSRHRRLLCITSTFKLEAWDVDHESPRLDWAAHFDSPVQHIPARPDLTKLNYIVCAERSGELFVVVRHVKLGGGAWVKRGMAKEYVGPTVYFEAYKVDRERRRLTKMEESLGGLSMFVGINDPIAIKDVAGGGLKPDSIYFAYDRRVRPLDGDDYGIFDCQKGALCHPSWISYQINNDVSRPVWFTPRRRRRLYDTVGCVG